MKFELNPNPQQVTAASLSRILRHFTPESIDNGVAIVSADRSDRGMTKKTATALKGDDATIEIDQKANEQFNRQARKRLEGVLRSMGKGFIKTKGGFKESGTGITVYEHSYVVPNVSTEEAKKLAKTLGKGADVNSKPEEEKIEHQASLQKDFRQDAILWGNTSIGVFLLYANGSREKIGQRFEPSTLQQYFTEWKKRRFAFAGTIESIEYQPTSPSDYRQWRRELVEQMMQINR